MSPVAERLNRACDCVGTDVLGLHRALDARLAPALAGTSLNSSHRHLFSPLPVFISADTARRITQLIDAISIAVRSPGYLTIALARAPAIAQRAVPALGVFFGYDFHVTPDGPKLIEINTNSGGALLNSELLRAQRACCPRLDDVLRMEQTPGGIEAAILDMFASEWRLARGDRPLTTVAIVDDDPGSQYLFPEFLLVRSLLARRGIETFVVDSRALDLRDGHLSHDGRRIDLVYNRTTDFYFVEESHRALRVAYESDAAVITPHPRAHAVYSHKLNLATLSDAAALSEMGLPRQVVETLSRGIPQTLRVDGPAENWWRERSRWFFKPAQGFGSRGAYRGDKLTRRVFDEIMRGDYVAQEIATPAERHCAAADQPGFKFDLRSYVYDGRQQLLAARLYQGQTTNFRSAGGGFAPVYTLRDPPLSAG